MDEAKALQDSHEAWKQANISRVKAEMERYGLTVADLLANDIDPGDNKPMVNIAGTQTPHQPSGNTVAGQ